MNNREFLQLAHKYKGSEIIAGWLLSRKLDGERCFWDGGVTRGMPKSEVPWANCDKDDRYRSVEIATGLWSRYGNVIHAPDAWLDLLPKCFLDGELYQHGCSRQEIHSRIKKLKPIDSEWQGIQLHVFDMPAASGVFQMGRINNPNFKKTIDPVACMSLISKQRSWDHSPFDRMRFETSQFVLCNNLQQTDVWVPVEQIDLPYNQIEAVKLLDKYTHRFIEEGYEGGMVRDSNTVYVPKRLQTMLKVKPEDDSEAVVIGCTTGEGKLKGKMGSLICQLDSGIVFQLSGFTDAERELTNPGWAMLRPGVKCNIDCQSVHFPIGTMITFKHRGTTDSGTPQEARYWRKYENHK